MTDQPILLYESQARAFGCPDDQIKLAKTIPQPCPKEWPVASKTWMVVDMLPKTK